MNQERLLAVTPVSRAGDPDTSALAEAEINTSGSRAAQQHEVLRWLLKYQNCTARELAEMAGGGFTRYEMAHKRLSELEPIYAQRREKRKCTVSGRMAYVWQATGKKPTGFTP